MSLITVSTFGGISRTWIRCAVCKNSSLEQETAMLWKQ